MVDQDYAAIKQAGCTAVLDIQNSYRSVEFGQEQSLLRKYGISTVKNVSVWDSHEEEYAANLFNAAVELDKMVNQQNQQVFLHCFTGISRSPTLLILYFALFLRHQQWNDIGEMAE